MAHSPQNNDHALEVLGEDLWARLTPGLIHEIASYLHPNDVCSSVKLLNRETMECLRDSFRTFVLSRRQGDRVWNPEKSHQAEQPWPGREFVAHWGGPSPWRSLSLAQRRRLVCLAASSGHLPSLDAALAQCGCTWQEEILIAAAAGGSVAACERLLGAGAEMDEAALAAAAAGGHVPVLRLLLDKIQNSGDADAANEMLMSMMPGRGACSAAARAGQLPTLQLLMDSAASGAVRTCIIWEVAAGACESGQQDILAWLQQAHGYIPSLEDALAAARGGRVALLEQLLQQVLQPDRPAAAAAGAGNDSEQNRVSRRDVLEAITASCPVEVLQRHYARLWSLQASEDANEGPGEDAAAASSSKLRRQLLFATAGSGTACWDRKLDFFMSAWGPDVVARELQRDAEGAFAYIPRLTTSRPDCKQRLRRLHAAGMPLGFQLMQYAAEHGHVDALTSFLDEAGAHASAIDVAIVRDFTFARRRAYANLQQLLGLLTERGYTFKVADVKMAASWGWPEQPLLAVIQMVVDGDTEEDTLSQWSESFAYAAHAGTSIGVLQALRARGAAVDLAAVAAGGSEEALDWAAAELEAEGQGGSSDGGALLTPLGKADAKVVYERGNLAALRWLHRRGLLDGRSVSWLAGRVELARAGEARNSTAL